MGWAVNDMPQPQYPQGRAPLPITEEAGGAKGLAWMG